MFALDPASQAELDEIDDDQLRRAVDRVLADPSGRRQPQHNYTRRFRNPRRYVKVAKSDAVWEFKPSRWRGLFVTAERTGGDGATHRLLVFVQVKGRRFWSMADCPWH